MEPRPVPAPSPEPDFGALVEAALDSLPETFRVRLGRVAIVVEDEPSAAQLASTGARGLFGLYQGVPTTAFGADHAPYASKITIFRGPHLRAYGTGSRLAPGVAGTVRHEIAHHFGISDARLRELDAERGRR
jgi:predicted Zn-dependent protease with MMP-like domain